MLIYLLRHGLTEYNAQKRYQGQRDIPLSAEGLSQLRRADIDPKVVYITPLQRTAQTARVLFPEAELVVVKDFQIEAVTRINNLAQRYDNGSEFPEVLIANYDMEERKKSMPMQMNLFELYGEQKTVRWRGKETEEEPQDT